MTEKLSDNLFDESYRIIKQRIKAAAEASGRSENDIILLAATKTVSTDRINYAIESGVSYIGENRVQEFISKKDGIISCHRHFIGHLQTNKVKDILPFVELIHSVDSLRLAQEISKQALRLNKTADILLEINIGNEESKSGFKASEAENAVRQIAKLPSVKIKGLMAIPPACENPEENRKYFSDMKKLFIDIGNKKIDNSSMELLSMGMSDDYAVAISEGANLVRIGSALFGKRSYNL